MEGDKSEDAQRGIKTSGTFPRYLLFRFFAATSFSVPSHSLMTNCPHFLEDIGGIALRSLSRFQRIIVVSVFGAPKDDLLLFNQ